MSYLAMILVAFLAETPCYSSHDERSKMLKPSLGGTKGPAGNRSSSVGRMNTSSATHSPKPKVFEAHLLWMHIPKTGTSFYLTLQHDQCYDRWPNNTSPESIQVQKGKAFIRGFNCNVETVGHGPLARNIPNYRVVAVFRNPKARIISSYADSMHHEGMSKGSWSLLQDKIRLARERQCKKNKDKGCWFSAGLAVYANDSTTKGCVARTMSGAWCMDDTVVPTQAMADAAVLRIRDFAFVGIFEEWNEMIQKFSRLRGHPPTHVGELDMIHVRPGKYSLGSTACMDGYFDPYDQAIYDAAVTINKERR
mmetsp:Transcript_20996/g.41596  ORF Transcript_20996/g.41596 Transcript_20996/m.41596 type:complete len:308 (+) Transcript_20996:217-1140(+)|eukprot:CAMPEP_0171667252 /NCGR_PEP_ID=MMETSP0990-20121206/48594_1 /TAXON_ID=483369 /ORGANISM="non described non described, Strain CCMP2098" /LENGTH=307 /DNA_ID=CAMNT_0012250937 /DNA_START=98 /DNA_END=1021 /DNA_ORIENTATION=+